MNCAELQSIFASHHKCETTREGIKISTHCLYPSAETVYVHVTKFGAQYRVSDGGDLVRIALVHGRDAKALDKPLQQAGDFHCVRSAAGMIYADVGDLDWLPAAIIAVANAAAMAASLVIEGSHRRIERTISTRIYNALTKAVPAQEIAKDYEFVGRSGKRWQVDFAVPAREKPILIKTVTPHHVSISSNYTTFGDIGEDATHRYCIFSQRLEQIDATLLRQVATLAPISALELNAPQTIYGLSSPLSSMSH